MSRLVQVSLGMYVHMRKDVVILVADDFDLNDTDKVDNILSVIYTRDGGDGFVEDTDSNAREGHHFIRRIFDERPAYVCDSNGNIMRVCE